MQPGLGGFAGQAKGRGDLAHGDLLDIDPQHEFAVIRRQVGQRTCQVEPKLLLGDAREAQVVLDDLQPHAVALPSEAQQPIALAPDHHEQPTGEGPRGAQGPDLPVQDPEGLLDRVVDIGDLAGRPGEAADVGLGEFEQGKERLLLAAPRIVQQSRWTVADRQDFGSLLPTIAHIGQNPTKPVRPTKTPVRARTIPTVVPAGPIRPVAATATPPTTRAILSNIGTFLV